jgi:hypothetical protein
MPQAHRTWIRTGDRRQPRIIGVPGTRQTVMPERAAGRADRHGPGRHGAAVNGCPKRPSPLPGIMLSNEGGQGERARSRLRGNLAAKAAA